MKNIIYTVPLLFLSIFTNIVTAQKQNNVWHFGYSAGLDFNSTPPVAVTGSADNLEGCASISDSEGNLLFYSNGESVWNRDHQLMPNGQGLEGGNSSTQAALIVPLPGSFSQYYLFTTGDDIYSGYGLAYSVVDMLADDGFGDIIISTKNTVVTDSTAEMQTAVLHANAEDIWIVTHKLNSTDFHAYLLTSAGLSSIPVISSIGNYYQLNSGGSTPGPIRSSHDGTKIVTAITYDGICEMFNFNPATGELTDHFDLKPLIPDQFIYGIEFSPNDSLLYVAGFPENGDSNLVIQLAIYQDPILSMNVGAFYEPSEEFGALQLAPDKKIYLARRFNSFIDVIHYPDQPGVACQYDPQSVALDSGTNSSYGLPNPAPYSFCPIPSLGGDRVLCEGDTLHLTVSLNSSPSCPQSFIWYDGTTDSIKVITGPGIYWAEINNSLFIYTDTIQIDSAVREELTVSICPGESYEGYTQTGTYIDTFNSIIGCDSIRILSLTANEFFVDTIDREICQGFSYEVYTKSGIYRDTLPNESCGYIRILRLTVIPCLRIINYDLDACKSVMSQGTHMDYSEFTPEYPNILNCAEIEAFNVFRAFPEKHSCTPGINESIGMCVSAVHECEYLPGDPASVIIEFKIDPPADSIVRFTKLGFYEKAPPTYNWINGPSGPNNFPYYFGIRILKNGTEIYRDAIIHTNPDWTFRSFDFVGNDDFDADTTTLFRIELLAYCTTSPTAEVSAWDIDDIHIFGGCVSPLKEIPGIDGTITTKDGRSVVDATVELSENITFAETQTEQTNENGYYVIEPLETGKSYHVKANKNHDVINGLSVADLVRIQKHILGIHPFTSLDQYVAADINRNGSITTTDLVQLKKLLLGRYTEFPYNTSWRFGTLPQDLGVLDLSKFQEVSSIESLFIDHQVDFMGIKIGDLNGDVDPDYSGIGFNSRSNTFFPVLFENQNITAGQLISVPLIAGKDIIMEGLQLTFDLNNFDIQNILPGKLSITGDDFMVHENGLLKLIWNGPEVAELRRDEVLLTMVLKPKVFGTLENNLQLKNDQLTSECYTPESPLPIEVKLNTVDPATAKPNTVDFQIEPNPFPDDFDLRFHLDETQKVVFRFYDVTGKLIHIIEKDYSSGDHVEHVAIGTTGSNAIIYCQMILQDDICIKKAVKGN